MAVWDSKYDLDSNGVINFPGDSLKVAARMGTIRGGGANSNGFVYGAQYDFNGDGVIDFSDFLDIFSHQGATRPVYVPPDPNSSIWTQAINVGGSTYTAAQITGFSRGYWDDVAFISVDSSYPVKTLTGTDVVNGGNKSIPVYCDPNMSHNGSWNGCCRFLSTDGSLWEGQPLVVSPGVDPHCSYLWPIAANQKRGCHGGSQISTGGTLTKGWTSGTINHVLGFNIAGWHYMNPSPLFVDPAHNADGYASSGDHAYAGTGPIHMGSRLALKVTDDISAITDPTVLKIAQALITYGAYLCDDTWDDGLSVHIAYDAEPIGSISQLITLWKKLWVVT